jgi:crotonobetainyl-CoA:carnitine CoA-transferase CaiB-like acyl-CoA transferase
MEQHRVAVDGRHAQGTGPAPLQGIRVVGLEHAVAAPLCTRHLADLGADVVKIERPEVGDFARSYDSMVGGESTYHAWLNRGKRSVVLDVKSAAGHAALEALLAGADVFVHNLGPGSVERMGFGWDALHERWPRLISCAITGYGTEGPLRDRKSFDLLLQGEAAIFSVTGTADAPAKVGLPLGDISAAMYALSAVLAAIIRRQATGDGSRIDVAMIDCLAEWMTPNLYQRMYSGEEPPRMGTRHNTICPYGTYPVGSDGSVNLAVQNARQWQGFCREVLGRPELIDDPSYASNQLRVRNRGRLDRLIEEEFTTRHVSDVIAALDRGDVPWADVNDTAGLAAHRQLESRERWVDIDSAQGTVRVLRPPFNISGYTPPLGALPGLGEQTASVLAEAGIDIPPQRDV